VRTPVHLLSCISLGAIALSAGCSQLLGVEDLSQSEPDAAVVGEDAATAGTARVRILHIARALPGDGLIDIYLGDESTPRLPAHGGLSDYLTVSSSRPTTISIRAQGQSGGEPLFTFDNLVFAENTDTTAVLTGIATSLTGDEAVRLLPVVEGYAQAGTGMTQVRFLNAIVDLPSVSIDFDFYGEATPEVGGLGRFDATPAAGMGRVSTAALRFGLVSDGATVAGFAIGSLPVGVGCLAVLHGKVVEPRQGRDALKAALACRTPTAAYPSRAEQAAVMHVLGDVQAPTTASLVESPARTIASNLGVRQVSTVWIAGEDQTFLDLVLPSRTINLGITNDLADAGKSLSLLGGALHPAAGDNDANLQTLSLSPAPTTGGRAVQFINMSVDVGYFDVVDQSSTQLAESVGFGSFSAQSTMNGGTYQLTFGDVDAGGTVAVFPFTVTGAGGSTLLVLEGALTPTSGQRPLRLTPVDVGVWPPQAATPIAPM
jgi:hypothetical protein